MPRDIIEHLKKTYVAKKPMKISRARGEGASRPDRKTEPKLKSKSGKTGKTKAEKSKKSKKAQTKAKPAKTKPGKAKPRKSGKPQGKS